jgi:pimeloyl-ACP methyl ester carboxylesterase
VLHLRGDAIVPFEFGRALASLIPNARLVTLEGNNHAMMPGDPAIPQLQEAA